MKRSFISLVSVALLCILAHGDPPAPPPTPQKVAGVSDPRSSQLLTLLYHNGDEAVQPLADALLIFARWDTNPSNTILGVNGSFSDEQIMAALKRFYREWHPPQNDPSASRPRIVLAAQNWGSGATLCELLKSLSAEFQLDVYMLYPVVTYIQPEPWHPTANDKRLGELIQPAPESRPASQPK
jgi:hypothetical protein